MILEIDEDELNFLINAVDTYVANNVPVWAEHSVKRAIKFETRLLELREANDEG